MSNPLHHNMKTEFLRLERDKTYHKARGYEPRPVSKAAEEEAERLERGFEMMDDDNE